MATTNELLRARLLSRSVQDGECIVWTGATLGKYRYGGLKVGRLTCYAHRLSYQIHKGEIPAGMVVMHTCDRPQCINPEHLKLGTQADNMADMYAKGRNTPTVGVINGRAKLTAEEVVTIRARYVHHCRKDGASAIAREYGLTPQAISALLRGESWVG